MRKYHITAGILILCFAAAAAHAEFYNRAPDTLPGLLPEMRNPSYWIAKMERPDEVILTPEQIRARNERYRERMASPGRFEGVAAERLPKQKDLNRWPGRFIVKPDIYAWSPADLADSVRTQVQDDIDFLRGEYLSDVEGLENVEGQAFGNILGIEYADWELDEMENEMNLAGIGETAEIREAITVCTARLRVVPTLTPERVGLMENGKTRWDVWNVNVIRIGSPVQVVHTSRTGGYVFALTGEGWGWIRSGEVAFGDRNDIEGFSTARDFVVCTGDRVPFYATPDCRYATGWFRMGDRLPRASDGDRFAVSIPYRNADGSFSRERAYLKPDADVHRGYLPYTRRNIVSLGFRMLDNPYDWTMAWYGRNHETALRDLFACFGIELPFNAELFTFYGDNTRVVMPDEGRQAQYNAILANEPFVTIQTCGGGHSQLFLGEYNGEPIVLDTHGYGYELDGVRYEIRRMVVGDMSQPEYFLRTPFSFLELK